jgi:hypothetical protein
MFIGQQVATQPDFMGIPVTTLALFGLGVAGFAIAAYKPTWNKMEILTYGSVAAIAFGIATYAGWVSKGPQATYRAPTSFAIRPTAPTAPVNSAAMGGVKLI